MTERFEHRPMDFIGVAFPQLVYIGVANRMAFDEIGIPVHDHGEGPNGHVLSKSVEQNGVRVVFQHWVKSLTSDARLADMRAKTEPARVTDGSVPDTENGRA